MKKEDREYSIRDVEMFLNSNNIDYNKKFLKISFKAIASEQPLKNGNEPKIHFSGVKRILVDFGLKHEIQDIFQQYSDETPSSIIKWDKKHLTKHDFNLFLKEIQHEKIANSQREIVQDQDTSFNFLDDECYSFFEFCQILFSSKNNIFNPDMAQLYQDMTQPLNDYFVNSSHNTYLLGNQLTGESSTQAYINALNKGCRCLEIDAWDGPKGTPIVTHGNTLTSKISFESVINSINDYAFQKNPYPVTLSIENHCCIQQQEEMVEIMQRIFKEKIYKPELNEKSTYKSPKDLQYKILLKCKGLKILNKSNEPRVDEGDFKIKIGRVGYDNGVRCTDIIAEEDCALNDSFFERPAVPIFESRLEGWKANRHLKNTKGSFPTLVNSSAPDSSKNFNSLEFDFFKSPDQAIFRSDGAGSIKVDFIPRAERKKDSQKEATAPSLKIPNFSLMVEEKTSETSPTKPAKPARKSMYPSSPGTEHKKVAKSRTSLLLTFLVSPKNKNQKGSEASFPSDDSNKSIYQNKDKVDEKISLKLHESLALFGYKLCDFERKAKPYEIASFSEKKLEKYLSKYYISIIELNKMSFTRAYPKGTRIDSSNYDPIPGFLCGVQFVALNFQTQDLNLGVYLSIFQQNGGANCGYVLKPDLLRNKILDERVSVLCKMGTQPHLRIRKSLMDVFGSVKSKNEFSNSNDLKVIAKVPPILELNLRLISGFQILQENGKPLAEPFYIEIFIRGFPNDENNNKKYISPYQNDCFHPIFEKVNLKFSFIFPEFGHLVFVLYKKNGKPLAFYSIPIDCIREGYRRIPLADFSFQQKPGSYLFCLIKKISFLKEMSL